MAAPYTLQTLKNGLRFRLGEPLAGVYGEWRYEDMSEGQELDELALALNEAQIFVAADLLESGIVYPFVTNFEETPVVPDAEAYSMPEDFMAMEEIRHHKGSVSKKLTEKNFKYIRGRSYTNWRATYYQHYMLRGTDSTILADGIASETSDSRLVARYGDLSNVRLGDIVHNLTDGSQARVTGISNGGLDLDDWRGGSSNRFIQGDSFRVYSLERTRWNLLVYPQLTDTNKSLYKGRTDFTLTTDARVTSMRFRLEGAPSDYGIFDEDEIITAVLKVEDTDELASTDPNSVGAVERVLTGWNTVPILPFNLREDVGYIMTLTNEEGSLNVEPNEIEIIQEPDETLRFSYYRTPAYMHYNDSFCELPPEFFGALYARAKMVCNEKFNPHGISPQLRQEYEIELKRSMDNLRSREEGGVIEIDTGTGQPMMDYHPGDEGWTDMLIR